MSNTITAKPAETPRSFAPIKSIIPRIIDGHANAGTLQAALQRIVAAAEHETEEFDGLVRTHTLNAAGRNHALATAISKAGSSTSSIVDAETRLAQDHLRQLEAELKTAPPITNPMLTQWVWTKLDAMPREDVNHLLSQTDDEQIVIAVLHGPAAFPFGSSDARKRMLANYNAKHRADKAQLAQALRDRIEAVANFLDAVLRELRTMLA